MLVLWRLGSLAVTACELRYPPFFKQININKVVKVILELFKMAKHSCNTQEHFLFSTDIYV